jgi:hypothetical protein
VALKTNWNCVVDVIVVRISALFDVSKLHLHTAKFVAYTAAAMALCEELVCGIVREGHVDYTLL